MPASQWGCCVSLTWQGGQNRRLHWVLVQQYKRWEMSAVGTPQFPLAQTAYKVASRASSSHLQHASSGSLQQSRYKHCCITTHVPVSDYIHLVTYTDSIIRPLLGGGGCPSECNLGLSREFPFFCVLPYLLELMARQHKMEFFKNLMRCLRGNAGADLTQTIIKVMALVIPVLCVLHYHCMHLVTF